MSRRLIALIVAVVLSSCLYAEGWRVLNRQMVIELQPIMAQVHDPIADHFNRHRWRCAGDGCADAEAIGRLATAIRAHSGRLDVPVRLMVGIVMVEDPWLDTLAVSTAGAQGLFQVMPMHKNAWPDCPDAMQTIEGSTCRGAEIIADFLRRGGSDTKALLLYNGCKRDYCKAYPQMVMAQAGLYD